MAKWELAVAVTDEPEAHRKKEGDIIAYMPAPHEWGKKETNEYLIIPFEGTEEEVRELCEPYFKSGRKFNERKYKEKKIKDKQGNEHTILELEDKDDDIPIAKRRHHFDFSKFKDIELPILGLDLSRIKDKTDHYQPFKDNRKPLKKGLIKDKHTGKFKGEL